jgi:hypothetical protein
VLDAVNLELRGIPAVVVGRDKLLNTTGKGMARAQGYPGLRFAVIPWMFSDSASDEELKESATEAASQAERILTSDGAAT